MKRYLPTLFLVLGLASCGGGGGGGGSDVPFFGGVWTGSASLVRNTCNLPVGQTVTNGFPHTVNQLDTEVVLEEAGGTTWRGIVRGTDGFLVGRSTPTSDYGNGLFCSTDAGIAYQNVEGDTGDVVFALALSCARGSEQLNCEIAYSGTVTRIN